MSYTQKIYIDMGLECDDTMTEFEKEWEFNFPLVSNIDAKTVGFDLKPVVPMTLEDAAQGRPIRRYPMKYDTFEDMETLREYILDQLRSYKYKAEWLRCSETAHLPIQMRDDVFFSPVTSIGIRCNDPEDRFPKDIMDINLHPKHWDQEEVEQMVNEIKETCKN